MTQKKRINKVIYDNKTLINLENDTVTSDTLSEGKTAHDKTGTPIVGTMKTGAVSSVNGKIGDVVITANDLGNLPIVSVSGTTLKFDNVIDVTNEINAVNEVIG